MPGSSLCDYYTPVNPAVSLVQDCQQKTKRSPQNHHLNTSCQSTFIVQENWMGAVPIPYYWGEHGKGSKDQCPWIMWKLILFCHVNTKSMWNQAGHTPAGQQELQRLQSRAVRAFQAAQTHCKWHAILHLISGCNSDYSHKLSHWGVTSWCTFTKMPGDNLFSRMGQNSQLLLTSLSSKCPRWVIIRYTWVSREEREGCGLIAFVWMDWVTAQSYIWYLDYFPSCILEVWISSGVRPLLIDI